MLRRIAVVMILVATLCAADVRAQVPSTKTFHKTWVNLNFVPCEGLGLTASGNIDLTVKYFTMYGKNWIKSVKLETNYAQESDIAASLKFKDSQGMRTVNLVKPWYPIISSPDLHLLTLPRAPSDMWFNKPPAEQQQAETSLVGTNLNLHGGVRFPQDGGNCFASFDEVFALD